MTAQIKRMIAKNFVFLHYTFVIATWILVILGKIYVFPGLQTAWAQTIYFTTAKLYLWILPVCLLLYSQRHEGFGYLKYRKFKSGFAKGVIAGILLTLFFAVLDLFMKRQFHSLQISATLLSGVIFTPLIEEFIFRGFYLNYLRKLGWKFLSAAFITSLLFLGLHLPGWLILQELDTVQLAINVFSVFILGLIWAVANRTTGSSFTSIAMHLINNFYSIGIVR